MQEINNKTQLKDPFVYAYYIFFREKWG